MEIRQLATFIKIIENQSFSRAAETLGYTQAAVTIQIQQLEKEFNGRLFDRIGRTVALTPMGKRFEVYAREILRQDEEAHKNIGGTVTRGYSLHIGTLDSLLSSKLMSIVRHFYIHFPETRMKVTTGTPQELQEMLDRNQVDILYLLDNPLADQRWVKAAEADEPIVFVASASSYLAKASSVTMEELTSLPMFLTEQDSNYRLALDQFFAANHLEIRPFFETGSTETIIRLIRRNQGVSFLPRFAVEESVKKGDLAVLSVENFSMSMSLQLIYHRNKWVTQEMKELIRLVNRELQG